MAPFSNPTEKPRRVWGPAGSSRANTPQDAYDRALQFITDSIRTPEFKANLDQQVACIHHIKKHANLLPPNELRIILGDLAEQFEGAMTLHRLTGILALDDPIDIRDALEATWIQPRPPEPTDDLYPKKGWLGAYLAYSRESNSPTAYHFWLGALLLGAAMRRNTYLPLGYKLYPNIYLMVVGDSGLGKGTAFGIAEPILHRANDHLLYTMMEYQWAPGMDLPPDRRVKVLDKQITSEAFYTMMKCYGAKGELLHFPMPPSEGDEYPPSLLCEDSVGVIFNEELITVADKSHYTSGIFKLLTALYTCDPNMGRQTIARGAERLGPPAISFAFGSTLEWINLSVTPDMFQGGFMSRCIFCYRTRESDTSYRYYPIAPPRDPVLRNTLAKTLVPWMLMNPARPFVFTPGAKRLWEHVWETNYKLMSKSEDARMVPYYERRSNHIGKTAMVLAASDLVTDFSTFDVEVLEARPSFRLDEETLTRALRIIEHEEQYLPECFARIGEHADSTRLDSLISKVADFNREHAAPMPRYGAHQVAKRIFGTDAVKSMELLVRMGMLEMMPVLRKTTSGPTPMGYRATGVPLKPRAPQPISPTLSEDTLTEGDREGEHPASESQPDPEGDSPG